MTPEEFTARANAAVGTIEPDPASYEWLSRNVTRRTRRRRALLAVAGATAVVATGVAVAVVPGGGDEPGHLAATTSPATPVVPPTRVTQPAVETTPPEPDWLGADQRSVDVDGDGRLDQVRLVREGDPAGDFRWGVQVVIAGRRNSTFWYECCGNEGQELGPIADLDGDGDREIAVSPGATATSRDWWLLTFDDPSTTRIFEAPELRMGLGENGEESWGCAERGGIVVTRSAIDPATGLPGTTGTRTYYRLEDGDRLVKTDEVRDTWEDGKRPAEYDYAFYCV